MFKSNISRRLLAASLGAFFGMFIYWCGGGEFARSLSFALALGCSALFGLVMFTCPILGGKE